MIQLKIFIINIFSLKIEALILQKRGDSAFVTMKQVGCKRDG